MPKMKTVAQAARKQKRRSKRARKADNCHIAKTVLTQKKDLAKWSKYPNKYDFATIDAPGHRITAYKRAKPGGSRKTVKVKGYIKKSGPTGHCSAAHP